MSTVQLLPLLLFLHIHFIVLIFFQFFLLSFFLPVLCVFLKPTLGLLSLRVLKYCWQCGEKPLNNIETVGSSGSEKDLTDTEGSAGTGTGTRSEIMVPEAMQDNLCRIQVHTIPPVNLVLRMR